MKAAVMAAAVFCAAMDDRVIRWTQKHTVLTNLLFQRIKYLARQAFKGFQTTTVLKTYCQVYWKITMCPTGFTEPSFVIKQLKY